MTIMKPKSSPRPASLLVTLVLATLAVSACDPTRSAGPLSEDMAQGSANEAATSADTSASTDTVPTTPADTTTQPDSTSTPASEPDVPTTGLQPTDTLFASSMSGVSNARREVIDSEEAWAAVWAELNASVVPVPETPEVDFGAHHVLLLTTGPRRSGGYAIDVESMTLEEGSLVVAVRETEPGASCMVTQSITHPAFAATVPADYDETVFEESTVVQECG